MKRTNRVILSLRGLGAARLAVLCLMMSAALAGAIEVPNPSFEEGTDAPAQWTLAGKTGAWIGDASDGAKAIATTGDGAEGTSSYWRSETLPLRQGQVYCLRFKARRLEGTGGCPITGPPFCNRDLSEMSTSWEQETSIFRVPDTAGPEEMFLRFGQWEVKGTLAYDAVQLRAAQPIYHTANGILLGEGERIHGAEYTFNAPFQAASANQSRPLALLECGYNKPRLNFCTSSKVIFCHSIDTCTQQSASIELTIGYYTGGEVLVETSADGTEWTEAGTIAETTTKSFAVPEARFPAKSLWVRLTGRDTEETPPCGLQLYGYAYHAVLDRAPGDSIGSTRFVSVEGETADATVLIQGFGDAMPGSENAFTALVEYTGQAARTVTPSLTLTQAGEEKVFSSTLELKPGLNAVRIPYDIATSGPLDVAFTLGEGLSYRAETSFNVPFLFNAGYGETLPGSSAAMGVWCCSSGWKVSDIRPMPKAQGAALRVAAARNEAEAVQLVVRPGRAFSEFFAEAGDLTGPGGAILPADCIDILRVGYVQVLIPTDSTGVAGAWPDPLPPLSAAIPLEAKKNQPLWIRVKPPREVPAGLYTGKIRLSAESYGLEVPFEVEVYGFDLPDRMTCQTAFGFWPEIAFKYQHVKRPEDRRAVYDMYLKSLTDAHINPYTPAELDPFTVTWPALENWSGGEIDTETKQVGAGALRLTDDAEDNNIGAGSDRLLPIPEKGVTLAFDYRAAEEGHPFIVTLRHFDASGAWMSGRNNDIPLTGGPEWKHFEQSIKTFPEGAKSIRIQLWPVLYAEGGATTGTVWFDALSVTSNETKKVLLQGDFEPPDAIPADRFVPEFDWTAWDAAVQRGMDEFHVNVLLIPVIGMGGGSFHSRYEPELFGYGESTPQYKAAFTNYCRAIESHLTEKGWLDESFVYWFDEPEPKDYDFVMNGFRKLKEAAPGIGRMLTEEVMPELEDGPNIWCPLTPNFDMDDAERRRAQGDRFWWYLCCGPHAPYVTLFIDHPGTELRVWLWQTWQRKIDGLLIWQTNHWTSNAAYPDTLQNPYEDCMSWTEGYDTPAGKKIPWGNGDGRFLYPPEAAATGQQDGLVLAPPVPAIRLEMLRDGIEDHEYLALLARLLKEKGAALDEAARANYAALLEVPADISESLTKFTTDPAPIEARRAQIARAIAALTAR